MIIFPTFLDLTFWNNDSLCVLDCSENCYQNFCQFAYGDDCRMYLTCEWTRNGFHGTKKVCPHGMFWSRDQPFQRDQANRTASCSLASDVQCPHGAYLLRAVSNSCYIEFLLYRMTTHLQITRVSITFFFVFHHKKKNNNISCVVCGSKLTYL